MRDDGAMMHPDDQQLFEQAFAGDRVAAGQLASRLDLGDAEYRNRLIALAEATEFPEVVQPLVQSAHLMGDVDLVSRWLDRSGFAQDLLAKTITIRDRRIEVERRAADGDGRASWELAVHLGHANDRDGLHRLATSGNAGAAVLLCDLAFWDDDIDLLRELARTGLAVCVANFILMADDREVENLAVAGSVMAFLHRCQDFIRAGDMEGLERFASSIREDTVWT